MTEEETFRLLRRLPFNRLFMRTNESWEETLEKAGWTLAEYNKEYVAETDRRISNILQQRANRKQATD